MTQEAFISVLVAEDNDISREMMSAVLRAHGLRVYGAVDGESAIKVVEDQHIDLALVDINMAPRGGFDFIKYLTAEGLDIPVVIVTADESSHILVEGSALGVAKIIHKPVDPDRLLQIVTRILKRRGLNPNPLMVTVGMEVNNTPIELMRKAIALAEKNARTRHGGPHGAVVAGAEGQVLGEGVNGGASRVDPVAHAEVMAIRQAAEKLGRADLSDCVLYCSSEPTMMGRALIESVGIRKVCYGLSAADVSARPPQAKPAYMQMAREEALAVFEAWKKQKL